MYIHKEIHKILLLYKLKVQVKIINRKIVVSIEEMKAMSVFLNKEIIEKVMAIEEEVRVEVIEAGEEECE